MRHGQRVVLWSRLDGAERTCPASQAPDGQMPCRWLLLRWVSRAGPGRRGVAWRWRPSVPRTLRGGRAYCLIPEEELMRLGRARRHVRHLFMLVAACRHRRRSVVPDGAGGWLGTGTCVRAVCQESGVPAGVAESPPAGRGPAVPGVGWCHAAVAAGGARPAPPSPSPSSVCWCVRPWICACCQGL